MTTHYEFTGGIWHVTIEDQDMSVVEAEMNRLRGSKDVTFIGVSKAGDKYVVKGMVHAASVG